MQTSHSGLSELIETLEEPLSKRLPQETCEQIKAFALHLYKSAAYDELAAWSNEALYGTTLSLWQFLQDFDGDQSKLKVFNPEFERDGWQSSHTVIQVLNVDMPFLVDSLRIALNQHGLTLHTIHNAVLRVQRQSGELAHLAAPQETLEASALESVIYMEIDRCSDEHELEGLREDLLKTLREVHVVVDDFAVMRDQALALANELSETPPPQLQASDVEEAATFLKWLTDDHFTFLGADDYDVQVVNGERKLVKVEGSEQGVFKLDDPRYSAQSLDSLSLDEHQFVLIPELLNFAKAPNMARVHRPAYPDYISIKRFNAQGEVVGERHILGLYTATVYNQTPRAIPVLRRKIHAVLEQAGLSLSGHNGKQLLQILEVYPRDDLFQIDTQELTQTALSIFNMRERRLVRVFLRTDPYARHYSALVYVPRDVFGTELRQRIQRLLCEELDAEFIDFNTYLSESVLARIQFIMRFNSDQPIEVDLEELEQRITQIARSWDDALHNALIDGYGEEKANAYARRYREAFPAAYREDFNARNAVFDISHMDALDAGDSISLTLYRNVEDADQLRFKVFKQHEPVPLSDVLPVMEHLGLRVLGERPYEISRSDSDCWIHDFSLSYTGDLDLAQVRDIFHQAFLHIWLGEAENDSFNRLVLAAHLDWRHVAMLRAYARYMKQIGFSFSQDYIANTLSQHGDITRDLVTLFDMRFDPEKTQSEAAESQCVSRIEQGLEKVASLSEDRILRRYLELIQATLRTNFYQPYAEGRAKPYISFKLEPRHISDMPKPRPMFEIFVYSPRVEGVHLRGSKVARGGLRWSDRHEDFRTEVLGLVKAQQVKNAVIVPAGAKGGFVCKRLPDASDREAFLAEGIECYKTFIRGLLDITDNLDGDAILPPAQVLRHDEDDPYLVVAADKGTATFSDIANGIAEEYGFWLGDAFASGGSQGYDHKKMGITARGAWVSVQRHFREMGHDVQREPFSVVGIGDMGGDVFGNGMLLSDQIKLVGAFNHKHIFIDPSPDVTASFKARQQLFAGPKSGWDDYPADLISKGGGVFSREAKSIVITPEMKACFEIKADRLTPNELISALLRSPVDLVWNGGIGTYVKAHDETHADVGDKANDTLRIDANQLRCRVVGEGGNLGMTQRARIEAAKAGVRLYTDFIDNAGGVNCSDHEVNIKIMLNQVVSNGDLTLKQRNQLLEDMTDEVAELVLNDSYTQAQALAVAEFGSREGVSHYRRMIDDLEHDGQLDRELEFLPSDDELAEREAEGLGITRPELAVLLAYAKSDIKASLLASDVPEDHWLSEQMLSRAFPEALRERFGDRLTEHRLKRELVATMLTNQLVDHMGITFVHRLQDTASLTIPDIVRGYVVARDVFDIPALWDALEALDHKVESALQLQMMHQLTRMMRRSTRWFVRHRFAGLSIREAVDHFTPKVRMIAELIGERLSGEALSDWKARHEQLVAADVPAELAGRLAGIQHLYNALNIIQAERDTGAKLPQVAEAYFLIGEKLALPWLNQQIVGLEVHDQWEAMARETYRDELDDRQRALAVSLLTLDEGAPDLEDRLTQWETRHAMQVDHWSQLLEDVRGGGSHVGYPLFAVAMRQLATLAISDADG